MRCLLFFWQRFWNSYMLTVFAHLPLFNQWNITSIRWSRNKKKIQRSRQANCLGTSSPDSFPTDRFTPRRSRERLNCKDEPSCSQANYHIKFVTVILLILIGHVRTVYLTVETSEFRWWQSSFFSNIILHLGNNLRALGAPQINRHFMPVSTFFDVCSWPENV